MKKFLKIIATLLILLIIVIGIFIATFKPPRFTDYGMYAGLFKWATVQFEQMQPRPVSEYFKNFSVQLGLPFTKVFGSPRLGVQLISFENKQLSAATISMFELPPGSGYYSVYHLEPRAALWLPGSDHAC